MKMKMIAVVLTALGLSASAAAQDDRSVFFVVSGGMTYGGDTLVTTNYTDGTSYDIRAGNLFQFGAGVLWQAPDQPFSVQATVNYHFDRNNAQNGDARFERTPIELLAFYNGVPKWRFGGGLRWSLSPTVSAHVDGGDDVTIHFKDAIGGVIEAGYKVAKAAWINARVGIEQYQAKDFTRNGQTYDASGADKTNGTHFGINLTWGF